MRFATLAALAVVVSTTPGLAAPAAYTPNRPNSKRDTATTDIDNIVNALVQNGTFSANVGSAITKLVNETVPVLEQLLGDAVNGTAANSTLASKRATSDNTATIESVLQDPSQLLGILKRASSSDYYQGLLQELESLGISTQRRSYGEDRRFELPEISPSTTSALENAANVATIGSGIAKVWEAVDGSSSSPNSKRESNTAIDERAFTSVTTWLKNLGNIASIAAGGAAVVGAVDGSSDSTILKRQAPNEVDLAALLNGATSRFQARTSSKVSSSEVSGLESALGKVAVVSSAGGFVASLLSAFDGSSNSTKREWTAIDGIGPDSLPIVETIPQFDERGVIPASVTTLLKNLGNVASIGAGAAAIAGALDGSSNSTFLKREFDQPSNGVDLASLLDGVTPQFEDRNVSSGEVSGFENVLGKAAGVASAGSFIASLLSAFEGSSTSASAPSPATSASAKRSTSDNGTSIPPDVLAMLQQIFSQSQDTGVNTQLASLD
ncbi:hypothetical protein K503DRAFT_783847 [Rhizopogon vinicolor AM-OR11-026]|uniref:Uncharacterized protein n=1 Tax=Rhizopogon vinicolor AM-OR11-026 TaxID=1314800 RepID=A0A1B7MX06_9AGAM|nr:hypothetical protein K503DRAFT_783847 [Rhizopogon vinicolor AM-OR11-026]